MLPQLRVAPEAASSMDSQGGSRLSLNQGAVRGANAPFPPGFSSTPQALAQQDAMAKQQREFIRQRLQQVHSPPPVWDWKGRAERALPMRARKAIRRSTESSGELGKGHSLEIMLVSQMLLSILMPSG